MTSCIVGKKVFYSHTFMHYKCDMKIGASRFIRVISLCHLVVCYHSWPWPGVLVSTCSLHGLVSLILSMMVYIGLKFFSAPSPSWGMAFKSRSQTFHTNVIFAYIIKTD